MSVRDPATSARHPFRHPVRRWSGRFDTAGRPLRCAAGCYLAVCLVLIGVYPLLSATLRTVAFLVVSLAALPAVLFGLRRTPAEDRRPWWMLIIALVSLNVDNAIWYWYVYARGRPSGDGTVATLFGTIGEVFLLIGALLLVIKRGRDDIGGLIDAAIVSMTVGGLLWDVVVLPQMRENQADMFAQASMCVDVFVLTGVLGALTRLLIGAHRQVSALWLLAAAIALSLVSNITLVVLINPVASARPAGTDMTLMGAYAALGLFGLDRSAAVLLRPGPAHAEGLSTGRLAFLGVALAAVPLIGGGRQVLGYDVDGLLLVTSAVTITPLVMLRIGRLSGQRARAERALLYQATHDALTGLANRHGFTARLAAATDADRSLLVLFCDLDGFKEVNDRHGHLVGDRVLIEVADRLRRCVRDGDVVCRFGGDEFLILCTDATVADSWELRRRIYAALRRPIVLDGRVIVVGASIGSVTGTGATSAEDLIHLADSAMYDAKKNRRQGDPAPPVHEGASLPP